MRTLPHFYYMRNRKKINYYFSKEYVEILLYIVASLVQPQFGKGTAGIFQLAGLCKLAF